MVFILLIVPILFATAIVYDQSATLPARFKRISRHSSTRMCPYLDGCSSAPRHHLPNSIGRPKHEQSALMIPQHSTHLHRNPQSLSVLLPERSLMPNLPTISATIWEQLTVVYNASTLASYTSTRFYKHITVLLANREQWLSPAVHVLIFTCGALKLTFQIMAAERPISVRTLQHFVQDFARMMIHVTKSVVIASFRAVALIALMTLVITLRVMESASREDLVTGPLL